MWVLDPPRSSSLPCPHGVRPSQLTSSTGPFRSWAMFPAMRAAFLLSVTLKSLSPSPSHGCPRQADLTPPLSAGVVVSSLRPTPQVPSQRWLWGRGAWHRGESLVSNSLCAHCLPTQGALNLKCLPHILPCTSSGSAPDPEPGLGFGPVAAAQAPALRHQPGCSVCKVSLWLQHIFSEASTPSPTLDSYYSFRLQSPAVKCWDCVSVSPSVKWRHHHMVVLEFTEENA